MGIFSLFKKKEVQKPSSQDDGDAPRPKREDDAAHSNTDVARLAAQVAQREIARATAMKIDAIESEMAFDIFNTPEPGWGKRPKRPTRPKVAPPVAEGRGEAEATGEFLNTLPLLDLATTEFLPESEIDDGMIELVASETSPVIEEIAILYASGQDDLVEAMLKAAVAEDALGASMRSAWWMLFDLYQITGKQMEFDSLSIDYASKYETSPPAWVEALARSPSAGSPGFSGVTPTVAFSGILDGAIAPQLERLQIQPDGGRMFRLEFTQVTEVDAEGCAMLLRALRALQKADAELIMVGAVELAEVIRASVEIGRRDPTDALWMLLLEMLRLLNREKEFEETSMDYCVTFEVSPPAFEPPKAAKVVTAPDERIHPGVSPDRFMMPQLFSGSAVSVMEGIKAYAAQCQPVVIDCSRLARVDFNAAGLLHNGLEPLSKEGKRIEFQDVNHLVGALLKVMGLDTMARIFLHRY